MNSKTLRWSFNIAGVFFGIVGFLFLFAPFIEVRFGELKTSINGFELFKQVMDGKILTEDRNVGFLAITPIVFATIMLFQSIGQLIRRILEVNGTISFKVKNYTIKYKLLFLVINVIGSIVPLILNIFILQLSGYDTVSSLFHVGYGAIVSGVLMFLSQIFVYFAWYLYLEEYNGSWNPTEKHNIEYLNKPTETEVNYRGYNNWY